MSLVLQSSSGGQITIQEPATASNFTQTLPAATGTVVITGTTPTLNGITFPATQVPSADANTLDDYEEGTWTPTIVGISSSGTATYATQDAKYVKVGKIVYITCYVAWSSATGTGQMAIGGLPFGGAGGAYQGLSLSGISSVTGSTSGYTWFGRVNSGENTIRILFANFATTTPGDGAINVCSAGTLLFSGCYTV
jgi:hypothetical protein